MRRELLREFRRLGFTVYDGPEIDFKHYNFNSLNMPEHHPARDMQDTFYLEGAPPRLLRTHTSTGQIRSMLSNENPPGVRVLCPGRVFRRDDDITHSRCSRARVKPSPVRYWRDRPPLPPPCDG